MVRGVNDFVSDTYIVHKHSEFHLYGIKHEIGLFCIFSVGTLVPVFVTLLIMLYCIICAVVAIMTC